MAEFEDHGLSAGVWTGVLRGAEAPRRVVLSLLGRVIAEAKMTEIAADQWQVSVRLPTDRLSDGVHSFLLLADSQADTGGPQEPGPGAELLARLSLVAGAPLDQELQAEMDLLRAEVDMLKREFRRLATQG